MDFLKACFHRDSWVDSQASPLTKCCELDVNSASYLWRVVDSESPTLCRVITFNKVITNSQHFVRRDACESTLSPSGNRPLQKDTAWVHPYNNIPHLITPYSHLPQYWDFLEMKTVLETLLMISDNLWFSPYLSCGLWMDVLQRCHWVCAGKIASPGGRVKQLLISSRNFVVKNQ